MAQAAAYIVTQRRETVKDLEIPCRDFYSHLTRETEHLKLQYRSSVPADLKRKGY